MSSDSLDLSISEIIRVQDFLDPDPEDRIFTSQDVIGQDVTTQDLTPAGPDDDPDDPEDLASFTNPINPPVADGIPDIDEPPSFTNSISPVVTHGSPDADHTTHLHLQPTPSSAAGDGYPFLKSGVINPASGTPSAGSYISRASYDDDDYDDYYDDYYDDDYDDDDDGGLSIAAKAGIGAGVGVLSFILIGLAVFLYLRRRHRRRAGHTATAGAADEASLTPPAADILRDKEMMHVAARGVADTSQHHQQPPPPPAPAGEDVDARGADEAAAPPAGRRAVSSTVAHLVEDGMTEAEIRRLEEEERALDRAIEQAVRK